MSPRNPGWTPSDDVAPICDSCGTVCDRGYGWTERDGAIVCVLCPSCRDIEQLDEWRKTKRLSSGFMLTATLRDYRKDPQYAEAASEVRAIEAAIKVFAFAWWPMLSETIDAEKVARGMSVAEDGLIVRSFVCAGRVLLHVERGDAFCSGLACEGDPSRGLGLQGIGATKDEAIALWNDAGKMFAGGAKLIADVNVRIL